VSETSQWLAWRLPRGLDSRAIATTPGDGKAGFELLTLRAHQVKGVKLAFDSFIAGKPHYAYFAEQGVGKTGMTIELLRQLYGHHKRPLKTLILCPAIVVKNWKAEMARFSHMEPMVCLLQGDKQKRVSLLRDAQHQDKHIFVTNLESLSTAEGFLWQTKTRGKSEIRVPIDHGWEVLIFDEIHRLKNPGAKSTKLAIKMADKCFFHYGLTGTPISQNEKDIWSIYRILDGGETFGKNFMAFQREWFIDENAGMPSAKYFPSWKLRPGSEGRMSELIYRKAFRVTKEECLDLPPLVQQTIGVEMGAEQRRVYDAMKKDFIAYLDSGVAVAQLAITKALRLQQIVSGFVKLEDDTEVVFADCPRLNGLADLLTDMPGKVIIWSVFKQNYAAIAKICTKLGRSHNFLTGEQTQKEKDKAELDFTKGDIDTLIASPAAGGTGVNLTEAADSIWYSRTWKYIDRVQAIARNHRGGSEMHQKVTMIDLCVLGTIDEHILAALDRKEAIADAILSWRDRV
jgi:SNF2 family DNA or RNA helicase